MSHFRKTCSSEKMSRVPFWIFITMGIYCFVPSENLNSYQCGKYFIISPIANLTLLIVIFGLQIGFTNFGKADVAFLLLRGYRSFVGVFVTFAMIVSWLIQRRQHQHFLLVSSSTIPRYFTIISCIVALSMTLDIVHILSEDDNKSASTLLNNFSSHLAFLYLGAHIIAVHLSIRQLYKLTGELNQQISSITDEQLIMKSEFQNEMIEKVRQCREQFVNLSILSRKLNKMFAMRDLLLVGHGFILGVLTTYGAVGNVVELASRENIITAITLLELFNQIKWTLMSFSVIICLIWPYSMIAVQRTETLDLLYRCLGNPIKNTVLRDELYNFVLQLFLDDPNNFSPYGFFIFNNKLLLSILGALLSYLVVLIQFRVLT